MLRKSRILPIVLLLIGTLSGMGSAQSRPDPAALIAGQRAAMIPLAYMDGAWRGTGWTMTPAGAKETFTQTERIGLFLDGSVRVIEGRGFDAEGKVRFNALGIVSYDLDKKTYSMRSYAMGHSGDFALTPTADGFTWEIPMGPSSIRYTATVKDGKWHEVGDRIVPGQDPVRFFEMNLERVGDTDWPAGGALTAK